jgi:hypothetical protein
MVLGVFHFANPGQDVIQTDQIDVLKPESQTYLTGLAERLSQFEPTAILVEVTPDREDSVNQEYRDYLSGTLELADSELHQLAFRAARASDLKRLYGFNDTGVHWNSGDLFDRIQSSEASLGKELEKTLDRLTQDIHEAHSTLSLRELLIMANDPGWDRRNKDVYLLTNVVGAGGGFVGADATARWWQRNFRMYANIQKHAKPGERLLVIAGQGHTAILKDLLAIDHRIVSEDPVPYL